MGLGIAGCACEVRGRRRPPWLERGSGGMRLLVLCGVLRSWGIGSEPPQPAAARRTQRRLWSTRPRCSRGSRPRWRRHWKIKLERGGVVDLPPPVMVVLLHLFQIRILFDIQNLIKFNMIIKNAIEKRPALLSKYTYEAGLFKNKLINIKDYLFGQYSSPAHH